eukprot:SAG31_NODE_48081_length_199_cov_37.230000_1_plen_23_part_01
MRWAALMVRWRWVAPDAGCEGDD